MYRFIVVASILFLLSAHTIHHCSLCNVHMSTTENANFKLSLDYGAIDKFPIQSSTAKIIWNGIQLALLQPKNRQIGRYQAKVKIIAGENTLSIKGAKGSTGLIIDNVKLVRQGNSESIVANGNFQKLSHHLKSTFDGWTGLPTAVSTKQLNKNWATSQGALIRADVKQSLAQVYNFDKEFRFQTDKYFLSFNYAAQAEASFATTQAQVNWNNEKFQIKPTDYKVHEFKTSLTVTKNKISTLTIKGSGDADGQGLTISNVKLTSLGSSINILLNGDFSTPNLKETIQSFDFLPGWEIANHLITLGKGSHFNDKWPKSIKQVLTLDNKENAEISQQISIGQNLQFIAKQYPYFSVSFDYAALDDVQLQQSAGELIWDKQVIAEFTIEDRNVHKYSQKVVVKPGANKFTFRPKAGSSFAISNFQVTREGLKDNIVDNWNFKLPPHKDLIPGWTGKAKLFDSEDLNQNWQETKVARLSSAQSQSLSQTFVIDKNYKFITNNFHLTLEFAATKNAKLNTPLAFLSWNGQDFPLIATGQKVQQFKTVVKAVRGPNLLTLSGQGNDGQGITVDNVKLIAFGSSSNAIINGDFENNQAKSGQQIFYLIDEWSGKNVQLGTGENYNSNWKSESNQVLSFATKHKTIISQVLTLSELSTINAKEPKTFTLSFKYAAEQGRPLEKSGGEIFWNKVLVADFVPTTYEITQFSMNLEAKKGENILFIKGGGGVQVYGMTLDEVKLTRLGSEDNLIYNGNFELPPTPGWNSIVHHAPLINHEWTKVDVGKIDANENLTLTAKLNFDNQYRFKTNKFNLVFEYAANEKTDLGKVEGSCNWNNIAFKLKPTDKKVQQFKKTVTGNQGENLLKFQGEGLTIDNVRLIPLGSISNVLSNGDFEAPQLTEKATNTVPSGWNGETLQFAKAFVFSPQWSFSSGQAVNLIKRRKYLSQTVILNKYNAIVRPQFAFFKLSLDYSGVKDEQNIISGQVYWNGKAVGSLKTNGLKINSFNVKVDAQSGKNTLSIVNKNKGVLVSNVKLIRYGQAESIVENGDFKEKTTAKGIPNWSGKISVSQSEKFNQNWSGSTVAVFSQQSGSTLSQDFEFDGNLRFITRKYVFSFQYAVRQGVKFETAKAKVIWNNKVIDFAPQDHKLHTYTEVVTARVGNNNLIFESNGVKRNFGIFAEGFDVDNVQLRPYGSSKNVLVNGGFDANKVEGFDYGMFTNKVHGWITKDIYIGVGYYFAKFWGWSQIMELDANHQNSKIMQVVKIDKHLKLNQ